MLLLTFLCLVPEKELNNVSAADNVVEDFTFFGANLCMPNTLLEDYLFLRTTFVEVSFSFSFTNGVYSASVNGHLLQTNYNEGISISATATNIPNSFNAGDPFSTYVLLRTVSNSIFYNDFRVSRFGNVSSNINRIVLTNHSQDNYYFNDVYYYDVHNNFICFSSLIMNRSSYVEDFLFTTRTYYINLNLSNNSYYEAGYTDGYNQGVSDGSNTGYTDGYNAGQTIGYDNGYSAGLIAGGDHTFMSLIGAVIDAPVSAFTSLLNFEILGVNLLGFITGLLTLAIIVFIIKLCMGGK